VKDPGQVSTKAPAFQFGTNANAAPKPADRQNGTIGTEKKPRAPAFSFGSTSATTTVSAAAATPVKTPLAPASAPTPAQQFQYGANPNSQPTGKIPPKIGAAPGASAPKAGDRASAVTAPSFGAAPGNPSAPAFGAAAPAASFGFGAPVAPTPPTFGATTAPSGFGAAAPLAPPAGGAVAPATTFGGVPAPVAGTSFGATPGPVATTFGGSASQSTSAPANSFQFGNQPVKRKNPQQTIFGNTKENTNPGSFNSGYQAAAPSNGFSKPQPTKGNYNPPLGMNAGFSAGTNNGAAPLSFDAGSAAVPGFSAGAAPAAVNGASARRMARKSRNRRR